MACKKARASAIPVIPKVLKKGPKGSSPSISHTHTADTSTLELSELQALMAEATAERKELVRAREDAEEKAVVSRRALEELQVSIMVICAVSYAVSYRAY